MLIRVVILFLIFILVMGMVQKMFRPNARLTKRNTPTLDRLRCPTCKRVNLTNTPAPCARPDCRYRS